jgi:hypothetical protein
MLALTEPVTVSVVMLIAVATLLALCITGLRAPRR